MAPTIPKKRPSMRSKATSKPASTPSNPGSGLISRPFGTSTREPSFINSKKDRRTIKHSAFISRIEKASKKPLKRRRANKKLVTTLEGLADALPDVEDLVKARLEGRGKGVERKSLKSKPGAMKRKEKLERRERERFGRNLAVIMGSQGAGMDAEGEQAIGSGEKKTEGTKGRFAALRAWVGTNMEKHPAFEKGVE